MTRMDWQERLLSRRRRPLLLFAHVDGILPFRGESIPELVVADIVGRERRGRWSTVDWRLEIVDALTAVELIPDFETRRLLPGATWGEALAAFRDRSQVAIREAAFRCDWPRIAPKAAARYDRAQLEVDALANSETAVEAAIRAARQKISRAD